MQTPTATILNKGSANMYSIKKEDYYLNKSIDKKPVERVNGITVERPNINLLRAKMDLAKQKAQEAVMARKEDVARKTEISKKIDSTRADSFRKDRVETVHKDSIKSESKRALSQGSDKETTREASKPSKINQGATSSGSSSGNRTYSGSSKGANSGSSSNSSNSSRRN